jgi:hypothetical protein
MDENKRQYSPDVYKRLELVRKQFQTGAAEQRRQESAARRQEFFDSLRRNSTRITRIASFVILGMIVLAVILVAVFSK